MYPDWVLLAIMFAALFIWLCILTYLYSKEARLLSKLFPKSESGDIRKRLEEVTQTVESFAKREEFFAKVLKEQTLEGLGHIQRVQILRYNPYNDTGGEQSFSLVLLDGKQNGILITSLHSRAGTRIYTKVISKGESDMELSKEEKEVLKKVIKE
jgi:Protein of unknown function (DUF4446)